MVQGRPFQSRWRYLSVRRSRLPAQIQTRDPDKSKRILALYQDRSIGISSPTSYITKAVVCIRVGPTSGARRCPRPLPLVGTADSRTGKSKTPTLAAARQRCGARWTSASEPCSYHECLAYMVAHPYACSCSLDVSLRASRTSSGAAQLCV